MLRSYIFAAVAILLAACSSPAIAPAPNASLAAIPSAVSSPSARPLSTPTDAYPDVDGARALEHVAYFADRARGGRFSGSPGYDDAARYVADRFKEIGLEPWGDNGTYFERFKMPLVDLAATPVLDRLGTDPRRFTHRTEFTERVGGLFGSGGGEGALVFIGSGQTTPGASDFDTVDVRGKIAIVITGGRNDPARELVARGAIGAIYVSTGTLLKFSYIARFESTTIAGVLVTSAVADDLLAPSGKKLTELVAAVQTQLRGAGSSPPPPSPAFELPVRLRIGVSLTPVRQIDATNVVGLLRGKDPEDAKRAVLVGGHLDGVGTDPDGTVFPAANDNASGPALTIEVARALVARRAELRHSIVFTAWAGEEEGLLGSDAFATQFSALPGRRESLLGYVNLDVVGCCGGSVSASTESDAMVQRVQQAAERLNVPFVKGGRGSSDQESFSKRGVPATLLDWGDIGVIHTTGDTLDKVTADRLRTIGRIAALVALEMAAGR
jgi:hypothetical protein